MTSWTRLRTLLRFGLAGLAASASVSVGCASILPPSTSLDRAPPRLLDAFFGLDDALPVEAVGLCAAAPGKDGMPVTFSRRFAADPDPRAFTVTTRSGARKTPVCATRRPAGADSERHTVLLIGDLGGVDDPPARLAITAPLPLEPGGDGVGLAVDVTPLADGPSLVLALAYPPGAIPSDCPATTEQLVLVAWAGGIKPSAGKGQDDHREAYALTTADGSTTVPFALGDLDDQDNYVHLCLETAAEVVRVSARAGVLVDPRDDLNPETSVDVNR